VRWSRLIAQKSLFNGKLAAGGANNVLGGVRPNELETIAKPSSTIWDKGTPIFRIAEMPDSLISTVRPSSTPWVRVRTLISTSSLKRGS
jgi:hypothetical protein